jgi:hypothetical protein
VQSQTSFGVVEGFNFKTEVESQGMQPVETEKTLKLAASDSIHNIKSATSPANLNADDSAVQEQQFSENADFAVAS